MSSESTAQTQSTTPTPTQVAISSDPLLCQWVQCGERCTSPEALYDHVCERHVGRKSTNNLNLQCAWGNCRTTTVKRDHITSHIRVHVPLKPHKCDFCGKSFKRPQDLKKHVKTHADDSVLLRSPQPDVPTQKAPVMNNYTHQATSRSYDTHYTNLSSQQGSYGYPTAVHGGGHFSQPTAIPSYGPVYYNMPQATNYATGPVDSRKRGMDDLNDFFGNAKRRHIDATQYQDLGARFGNMMNMGMPMPGFQAGYNAGLAAAGATMVDDMMGPLNFAPTHAAHGMTKQYLPFPELKTKDDLMSIDQFLENLQTTVYESTESGVSTGIPTGVQPVNTGYANATAYRHSPPYLSPHTASSHANTPGGLSSYGVPSSASSATFDDTTPALTPSSHLAASQSPASTQNHISPAPRPLTGNGLYPTLPSFSSLTDVQSQPLASYTTSTTQLSSLGPSYDDLEARRCYSGGYLQRAPRISPPSRPYDGSDTTSPSSRRSSIDLSKPFRNVGISSPPNNNVKLPGVAAITRVESVSSVSSDGSADERQEAWVRNMRVIEALQRYVKDRLEKGEFENTDGDSLMSDDGREGVESTREKTGQVVYPTLRPVQAMS